MQYLSVRTKTDELTEISHGITSVDAEERGCPYLFRPHEFGALTICPAARAAAVIAIRSARTSGVESLSAMHLV